MGIVVAMVAACLLMSEMSGSATADPAVAPGATAGDLRSLINRERLERGLEPVHVSAKLATAARRHAGDMVDRGYASHVSPGGSTLHTRVEDAGYLKGATRWVLGEAIAWGTGAKATSDAIVDALMHSPAHKAILLDARVREVGIGLVDGLPRPDGKGVAGVTVTFDFGWTDRVAETSAARQARAHRASVRPAGQRSRLTFDGWRR